MDGQVWDITYTAKCWLHSSFTVNCMIICMYLSIFMRKSWTKISRTRLWMYPHSRDSQRTVGCPCLLFLFLCLIHNHFFYWFIHMSQSLTAKIITDLYFLVPETDIMMVLFLISKIAGNNIHWFRLGLAPTYGPIKCGRKDNASWTNCVC